MKGIAFCDYPNYHAFSIINNFNLTSRAVVTKYHFLDTPKHRVGNKWESVESEKFSFNLIFLKNWIKSDFIVFFGVFNPLLIVFPIFILSALFGKKILICSEGFKSKEKSFLKCILKMIIKFLRQSNIALLCIGDGCKDDYISIGFDRVEFLKFGFFEEYKVLDNNYYKSLTDKYNILSNINEPLNLLFVGQLIKRKNLHGVLKELIQSSRNITLNVAGDGPLKMELLSICNDFPTNINVIFHGHCSENELDTLYRNSHAFILFSKYEGWGAVVNQAVHYHLPILLSNNVRSGKDFLLCNNNGLQFNTERELVEFIDKADINTLLTMATNNNSINEEWCISNASIRLLNFIIYNEIYNSGPLSRI